MISIDRCLLSNYRCPICREPTKEAKKLHYYLIGNCDILFFIDNTIKNCEFNINSLDFTKEENIDTFKKKFISLFQENEKYTKKLISKIEECHSLRKQSEELGLKFKIENVLMLLFK